MKLIFLRVSQSFCIILSNKEVTLLVFYLLQILNETIFYKKT